jgi:hypothetical protein
VLFDGDPAANEQAKVALAQLAQRFIWGSERGHVQGSNCSRKVSYSP